MRISTLQKGIPKFSNPDFKSGEFVKILLSSFTVVLVGFMEAYAISKKYATKMNYSINVNQVSLRGGGKSVSRFTVLFLVSFSKGLKQW